MRKTAGILNVRVVERDSVWSGRKPLRVFCVKCLWIRVPQERRPRAGSTAEFCNGVLMKSHRAPGIEANRST
jgi:hypothetical protein